MDGFETTFSQLSQGLDFARTSESISEQDVNFSGVVNWGPWKVSEKKDNQAMISEQAQGISYFNQNDGDCIFAKRIRSDNPNLQEAVDSDDSSWTGSVIDEDISQRPESGDLSDERVLPDLLRDVSSERPEFPDSSVQLNWGLRIASCSGKEKQRMLEAICKQIKTKSPAFLPRDAKNAVVTNVCGDLHTYPFFETINYFTQNGQKYLNYSGPYVECVTDDQNILKVIVIKPVVSLTDLSWLPKLPGKRTSGGGRAHLNIDDSLTDLTWLQKLSYGGSLAGKIKKMQIKYWRERVISCFEQGESLKLDTIYKRFQNKYPSLRSLNSDEKWWKNAVRHTLTTKSDFAKTPKPEGMKGKGGFWCLRSPVVEVHKRF